MKPQKHYGSATWTTHALERLQARKLPQDLAYRTFTNPDHYSPGKKNDTWEYQKKFQNHQVTVVAKQNEQKQWIILSCWVDPPFAGSIDIRKQNFYKKYQKAGFWGKFWLTFLRQIGLQ
ncbi:MAG: hypothetical protein KatS3mg087_0703 [Patescibacteria group bacterium]|nr:MAG: hypothetical protein KatS3mg087_0703 [Patescibacteria group bacterium]